MKKTKLEILDEINIRFHDLDTVTRNKMSNACKYFIPHARHTPMFKLGRWDGTIRYCDIGGRSYLYLLEKLLPIVTEAGYEIEVIDHRVEYNFEFEKVEKDSYSHVKWPTGHRFEGAPIELLEHQVEAANAYLNNLQSLQCLSTSAGKTVLSAVICDRASKYGRTIVIVPNKDLVLQTEADFINFGLDVGVYYGDRKEINKTHTICTWQSIEALDKKGKANDIDNLVDIFLKDVVAVIVDECHGLKSDVLKKHMGTHFKNVPIRWGMTGTIPKEEHFAISLYCTVGPVVNNVTARELQEKGILSTCEVEVLQFQDPILGLKNYQEELKWLVTDKKRITKISNIIKEKRSTGNTLVLVDRLETGQLLEELIENSVFVSGDMKSSKRKEHYENVHKSEDMVIIATYGVAAVGINVPRLFNLFMLESGKSFVRVIQSIGRGLRKAQDKDHVNIYDVCSNTKFSKKHLAERKKFYNEAEYPYKIKKVDY